MWGKIILLSGHLTYRIPESALDETRLNEAVYGVVKPIVIHAVLPQAGVRFYVEFYRAAYVVPSQLLRAVESK